MVSAADILEASILVVDDRPSNVVLLDQLLREAGYHSIASTRDPHEVAPLHQRHRYDLILLDLEMPGMDGFQVMEALKEVEAAGYLPVLAITALPGLKLRALKAGAKDFISKPFDLGEVLIRVHNMLEVRLLHRASQRLYAQLLAEDVALHMEIDERKRTEEALRLARAQLSLHAESLEEIVAERTIKLASANKRQEASLRLIRKANEEHQALLIESRVSERKLGQLTRQIISAQEDERKQISRELHDEVVQTLVGLNIELATLANEAAGPLGRKITHTQRLVEQSVDEIHRFARKLRPTMLDDLGLVSALQSYVDSMPNRKAIEIHITAGDGVEALDEAGRTVLFRVAQEALTNVTRHSHATRVEIELSQIAGAILMEIRDNGRAFNVGNTVSAKNPKRLGLVGMRERMEIVGGSLSIESMPGTGTTVRAEIPLTLVGDLTLRTEA
jgi:signal transduction histidine kinase